MKYIIIKKILMFDVGEYFRTGRENKGTSEKCGGLG